MTERALVRSRIEAALADADFPRSLEALADIEPPKRLGPLFSALLGREPLTRWRAVVALGDVAAALAVTSPERARDFWRNLMWRVNEESGTIGWGIPEVMGETLARCPSLADDYARILIGYVRDLPGQSSYLDHAPPAARGLVGHRPTGRGPAGSRRRSPGSPARRPGRSRSGGPGPGLPDPWPASARQPLRP